MAESHNDRTHADLSYGEIMGRRHQRNLNRRLFREMIKAELEDRSLTWLRRHMLLRFAARIDIDPFEARLIIRGVEFETGRARPISEEDTLGEIQPDYLAPGNSAASFAVQMIAVGVIVCIAAAFWLIGRS